MVISELAYLIVHLIQLGEPRIAPNIITKNIEQIRCEDKK